MFYDFELNIYNENNVLLRNIIIRERDFLEASGKLYNEIYHYKKSEKTLPYRIELKER